MAQYYIEQLGKIKGFILDCLFPNPTVSDRLPLYKTLFCNVCRARLPENKKICHKDSPLLLGAATQYGQKSVHQTIWRLKYRGRTALAQPLANILIRYASKLDLSLEGFIVVPVPLSKERRRARGFNQSELIADIFANHFRLAMAPQLLIRIKNTKPQAEVSDWDMRRENIEGAFAPAGEAGAISGKNIILIDDVSTSGSTLAEAARALKTGGAKKIIGLVIARAG